MSSIPNRYAKAGTYPFIYVYERSDSEQGRSLAQGLSGHSRVVI